jgi:hypothetical protein
LDFIRFHLRGLRWHSFLDYFEYRKSSVLQQLQGEFGYKPYPFKHYESVFTRFYQGLILPEKFGVDKRRLHLSTLVMNGEIPRNEALKGLEGIAYENERLLKQDIRYFLKKMGWPEGKLAEYLKRPAVPHDAYPTERPLWDFTLGLYRKADGVRSR